MTFAGGRQEPRSRRNTTKCGVLATAALLVLTSVSATAAPEIKDADGNGISTMDGRKAAFPDLTEVTFKAADTNGDGRLSADELAAVQEAGTIPAWSDAERQPGSA
ncbi:MAG: hypothetical protein B7Y02_13610 [Rhodobacterales bacterium 17-64-5]|nr:MAG: hypothetical protein B7Y02_13610 [Rhodobacterales bacterium 17-64-5]